MTTIQYITVRAPLYAAEPDINDFIEQAELETSNNYCGNDNMRNKAVALLVCHWKALGKRGGDGNNSEGIAGSLLSEKEGDLARRYTNVGNITDNVYLSQTSWGLELLQLQESTMFLPRNRFIK